MKFASLMLIVCMVAIAFVVAVPQAQAGGFALRRAPIRSAFTGRQTFVVQQQRVAIVRQPVVVQRFVAPHAFIAPQVVVPYSAPAAIVVPQCHSQALFFGY